jgi:predicted glutamine amidotransferase
MCIAILSPKGKRLTKETLKICWENNYNGAGFSYNDDNNKMHVVKEMEDFEKFYNKYRKASLKYPNSAFMLHFRISTHGVINRANCHPFKVNNQLAFCHNGQIREVDKHEKYSDTNMFNRQILRQIPNLTIDMLKSKGINEMMGSFIGYSKLVFMDNFNNYAIVNEEKGHWNDGIWYSNDSYKEYKDYIDYGGTKVKRSSGSSTSGSHSGSYYGGRNSNTIGYGSSYSWSANELFEPSYRIGHSGDTCECCGVPLVEGELLDKHGNCMECATAYDAATAYSDANADGFSVTDYESSKVKTLSSGNDPCDMCKSTDNVTEYPDMRCNLCDDCVEELTDEGVIDSLNSFENDNTEFSDDLSA